MSDAAIIITGTIYRIVGILVGLVIIYLGYRLFLKPPEPNAGDAGSMTGAIGTWKLTLKRAAPGTFFVVLGAGVILMSILKGVSLSEKGPGGREIAVTQAVPPATGRDVSDSAGATQQGKNAANPVAPNGGSRKVEFVGKPPAVDSMKPPLKPDIVRPTVKAGAAVRAGAATVVRHP